MSELYGEPYWTRELARTFGVGGGGLKTENQIRDFIHNVVAPQLGIVVDNVGDLPGDATARASGGTFDDPLALLDWLMIGGTLVHHDAAAQTSTPSGFVYLLETFNETLNQYEYTVYIRASSE